ncbi:hypothetical protein Vadar_027910 [Vaccinium darrowii]|uniref:Uncharacterized protein n=1 Tax=Vaccinium darrowii TaxID=229202 RepID=A0ACB7XUJ8_9ERIC|nr:hypothetical protein Vadar_027910 [Vaccinium darrowii]
MATKMSSAKGDWALSYEGHAELQRWIKEVDFDESLLLWNNSTNPNGDDKKKFRHMSKLLSDYILYLLIVEPSMISNLDEGQQQSQTSCCFNKSCSEGEKGLDTLKIRVCDSILSVVN